MKNEKFIKICFVFKSKNELYFRHTDYFWISFFFLIVKSNFSIYIKIISKQNIYLGYFSNQELYRFEEDLLDWERYCELVPYFLFIHTETMHKMQVKEMRDFLSQKNTFKEISAIIQTRHPCIRGYSVKSIKPFCEKKGISSRISQDHVWAMISEAVADEVQKELLQNLYFWVILLAFWIFLDKTTVFKSFFFNSD